MAGERHGPPEDCGGTPGFYNLLEALSSHGCFSRAQRAPRRSRSRR
ncbi:MAG: plasmid pRiA4b ORF-3 family protein [Acidobacteria bacterium]|nr:plasmid pRiA4b ORF-3 family protein [Acidobacteriota bacterium]